ncbi:class I SAM-dependent methyltransferase [Gammaproteobacteria bacterium]|nr:class I SAM-dependent methyltransferase [Gammaproteobacteria bacterium]
MKCRHCDDSLEHLFLDLGFAPPSNAYLTEFDLNSPELYFALKLLVCEKCWLVQTEDYTKADELFSNDYAYFSSVSQGWLDHSLAYFRLVRERFSLNSNSYVVEVASNDGYLLKNFVAEGIPCLGIEPTASTASAAEELGVPVLREFFCSDLAQKLIEEKKYADLIIGNNVYAHVPDINDFTKGLKKLLKSDGVITLEFPHLMKLIEHVQFDTAYHEHFSYLSLTTVSRIFSNEGLRIWDVEELNTHGGSLRVYGCHENSKRVNTSKVNQILNQELKSGLLDIMTYKEFQARADKVRNALTSFLIDQKNAGSSVAAYGAAAKGNTILNYAGIKTDLLPYVCDSAPSKQGKYMPGSHIPILSPNVLRERKPEYILILPWNIAEEVLGEYSYAKEWGAKFVTAVPELRIIE